MYHTRAFYLQGQIGRTGSILKWTERISEDFRISKERNCKWKALYEQIVNEAETILLQVIDNECELSNCLSINHLVEETIILIKQKQNAAKREFFAIVLNMKIDSLRF